MNLSITLYLIVSVLHIGGSDVLCKSSESGCWRNTVKPYSVRNNIVSENLQTPRHIGPLINQKSESPENTDSTSITVVATTTESGKEGEASNLGAGKYFRAEEEGKVTTITDMLDTTTDILDTTTDMLDTTTDILDSTTDILDTTTDILDSTTDMLDTTTDILDSTTDMLDTTRGMDVLTGNSGIIHEATTEEEIPNDDTSRYLKEDWPRSLAARQMWTHNEDKDYAQYTQPTHPQKAVSQLAKRSDGVNLVGPGMRTSGDPSWTNVTVTLEADLPQGFVFREEYEHLLSCHNRCGFSFESPCSCHSLCILYNNCCHDFHVRCLTVLSDAVEGLSRDLRQATVECVGSPQLSVLMVTQCPKDVEEKKDNHIMVDTEETTSVEILTGSFEEQIQPALEKRPCSDATTGITYPNKNVYDCYATENSVLQYWKPMFGLTNSVDVPGTLDDFSSVLNFSDFTFLPPSGMPIQKCPRQIFDSCPAGNASQDLQTKCSQGSISYLVIRFFKSLSDIGIFKNLYCLLCNVHGKENKTVEILHQIIQIRTGSTLGVLMTLTNTGKVVYQSARSNPIRWSQIECDTTSRQTKCKTRTCKRPDVLPENDCLKPVNIIISLDNYFTEVLEAVKEDLVCYLHNNDQVQRPQLQQPTDKRPGHHVFYINALTSSQLLKLGKTVQIHLFDIIGHHLYNKMKTELPESEAVSEDDIEPEGVEDDVSESQGVESKMAPTTTTAGILLESTSDGPFVSESTSDRPIVSESTSDRLIVSESTSDRPIVSESTSDGPIVSESTSDRPIVSESTSDRPIVSESTSDRPIVSESTSDRPIVSESASDVQTTLESTSDRPTLLETGTDRPILPESTSDSRTSVETTSDNLNVQLTSPSQCNQTTCTKKVSQIVEARACVIIISSKKTTDLNYDLDKYCSKYNLKVFEIGNFTNGSPVIKLPVFNSSRCEDLKKISATGPVSTLPADVTRAEKNAASHFGGCKDKILLIWLSSVVAVVVVVFKLRR